VPTSALVFPKKGRRRALVCAFMVPTGDGGQPYCYGERIFTHDQSFYGYLEYEQRDAAFDRAVLSLALSLGAAGGAIGRAEAGVLRAYRAERLTGLEGEEATRRRAHIDEVIAGFTEAITRQGRSARELWEESCRQVTDAGDDQVSLEAYELALRLATADGRATREELEMLKATAGRLGIPPEADRELRDRYFKLAMFEERKAQHVLDMPEGLSRQEQIDFLNREYRKWRGRATHPDPEMAAEATARLERIAAARRALEES